MQENREWGCGQIYCLCCSFLPCSRGPSPQKAVLHELLQSASFLRAAVLHELFLLGSLPVGWGLSGRDCSSMGPPQDHKSCQQTLYSSILHTATGPARSLLQHRLPGFLRHAPVLVWDPPQAVGGDLLHHRPPLRHPTSPWSGPWAAMESQLQCLKHHLLLLLFHCPCLQSCFPHISLPSLTAAAIAQGFFNPFLKGITPAVPPLSLIGSALASDRLMLDPTGHRGNFQQLLTEVTPVVAPKPKSRHANPIQIQSERGKKTKIHSLLNNLPHTFPGLHFRYKGEIKQIAVRSF